MDVKDFSVTSRINESGTKTIVIEIELSKKSCDCNCKTSKSKEMVVKDYYESEGGSSIQDMSSINLMSSLCKVMNIDVHKEVSKTVGVLTQVMNMLKTPDDIAEETARLIEDE